MMNLAIKIHSSKDAIQKIKKESLNLKEGIYNIYICM